MARTAEEVRRARPDRLPPHSIEAEESVLGSMMLSSEAIASVVEAIKPTDFYRPANQRIYQGKSEEDARRLLDEAQALDKSGIFSLVLEGIPAGLAAQITESVSVPTIGIGAGPRCDGQVLVINDLLGLGFGTYPKFVKPYADLRGEITRAVQSFRDEVAAGTFPDEAHSYH